MTAKWLAKLFGKPVAPETGAEKKTRIISDDTRDTDNTLRIQFKPPKQQYIVKIDGEYFCFDSKREMPDHLRIEVEQIENAADTSGSYTVITAGERKSYQHFEEMPEEVQRVVRTSAMAGK